LVNIRPRVQPKQEVYIPGKYFRGQGEPEGIEDFADEEFEEDDYQNYRATADNNNQQSKAAAGTSISAMEGTEEEKRN
jgi:hypothetical protein